MLGVFLSKAAQITELQRNIRCADVLEMQHLYKTFKLSQRSMCPHKELFELMRLLYLLIRAAMPVWVCVTCIPFPLRSGITIQTPSSLSWLTLSVILLSKVFIVNTVCVSSSIKVCAVMSWHYDLMVLKTLDKCLKSIETEYFY